MTDALLAARPHFSEYELAAEGARGLWARGIEPALVLAAAHSLPEAPLSAV